MRDVHRSHRARLAEAWRRNSESMHIARVASIRMQVDCRDEVVWGNDGRKLGSRVFLTLLLPPVSHLQAIQ